MKKPVFPGKHIIFCLKLVIIWQSHSSGFKFQAEAANQELPGRVLAQPTEDASKADNQQLPATEVTALNNMVYQLKPKSTISSFVSAYCKNPQTSSYIVTCNQDCYVKKTGCHIDKVILANMGLSGTIDAGISDLSQVTSIDLSGNQISGPIPDALGNLPNLIYLDLSSNQLTGTIPDSLGNLLSLQKLYLYKNFLEGGIPSSLGKLENLTHLVLYYNKLSGSLPASLGNLKQLEYLSLGENRLSGTFPPELGNLRYLISFYVPANLFSGDLPNFENLTSLRWFIVSGNKLTGSLPLYITKWTSLQSLNLLGNNFDGPIPVEYFQMSSLETMIITDLAGTTEVQLPREANLKTIYILVLRNCLLSGLIPDFIGKLSTLKRLDLSFNKLTGKVPESMTANLIYMSLARNNLNGTIPNWIHQATKTRMDLSYNNFSTMDVPIPSNLDLNLFACCCCHVSSTTEPYMLQPDKMAEEYSRGKKKSYSLYINSGGPKTHLEKTLYEADNSTLPFYISPAQNWGYSFSGDFLTTTANSSDYTQRVPCSISNSETSLYDDARLAPLSLNYYGFGLRKGHYNVTLHFAEIMYADDANYDVLRKRFFDIYVQDKIHMKDFDITAYAGGPNKVITVDVDINITEKDSVLNVFLYWAGRGTYVDFPAFNGPLIAAVSVDPLFNVDEGKLSPWKIALIALASLVALILIFLALAWAMGLLENKELKERVKVGEPYNADGQDITVTLKELVSSTGKFRKENEIGSGYLGAVYKAEVIKNPEITVAVKKLFPRHKGKIFGSIKKEILLLTALKSENLVKLFDVHIGESLQLFIYEYMEKESLEYALFNSKVGTFPWRTRLDICKGIATGLNSLHQYSVYKIVHGNLKASNILLDKDYKPKLSDFGYAGIYNEEDKFSVLKQNAPRGILAPEYCDNVTVKTDIYSFGVILLEIVAGHGNKESKGNQETTDLVDKVHYHFKAKIPSVSGFIDKKLEGDKDLNEQEVEVVLRLAVMCTSSQSLRPSISDVLSVLNGDKNVDDISLVGSPSRSNTALVSVSASASSK